jgi:hypothetical protein
LVLFHEKTVVFVQIEQAKSRKNHEICFTAPHTLLSVCPTSEVIDRIPQSAFQHAAHAPPEQRGEPAPHVGFAEVPKQFILTPEKFACFAKGLRSKDEEFHVYAGAKNVPPGNRTERLL